MSDPRHARVLGDILRTDMDAHRPLSDHSGADDPFSRCGTDHRPRWPPARTAPRTVEHRRVRREPKRRCIRSS